MNAAAIRKLVEFGLNAEQIASVAEAMEEPAHRSAAAERQARYRDRVKAGNNVTGDVTRYVTNGTPSPSKEGPHTPKETQPLPPTTLKEKTPKGVQKKASRLPAGWVLPVEWHDIATGLGLPSHLVQREAEKMLDWSLSSPSGAKTDWLATWRNWCRSAVDRLPQARGSPKREETVSDVIARLKTEMAQADDEPNPYPDRNRTLALAFSEGEYRRNG